MGFKSVNFLAFTTAKNNFFIQDLVWLGLVWQFDGFLQKLKSILMSFDKLRRKGKLLALKCKWKCLIFFKNCLVLVGWSVGRFGLMPIPISRLAGASLIGLIW